MQAMIFRQSIFVFILSAAFLSGTQPVLAADITFSPEAEAALRQVRALDTEVQDMAMQLWDFSEISLQEHRSAALLADRLEQEGFRLVRGVAGMPTAFTAEWGSGKPVIGIVAEYDALPNIGNDPVPKEQARDDGNPHGHGCGHNLFGAGSVGAAIAMKRAMEAENVAGTIRLYGSPAEETLIGKVYMVNAGLFDDLDAALDWHPWTETGISNQGGQAMNNFAVEFFGKASHGAADPWNGRSALDAVELMSVAVNMMREHIKPTARIHSVITSGGEAPNVVPAYARVWYYVRDNDRVSVEQNYQWILSIAAAAAQATQTKHKVTLETGVHEMLLNRPLQELADNNLQMIGAPQYGEEDQAFARELQTFLGREPLGMNVELLPLQPEQEETEGGSTDVAEISWKVPTVSLYVASAGAGLPWHSWATAASHGRPGAARAAQVAARVLAVTGMDLLTSPEILERAKAYHQEKTKGVPYVSPIPVDQKPTLPETGNP
jgi:aminobenzoyl-glutamate utilization protein B